MASHKALNNFSAGEWTPQLDARSDLQKYDMACAVLENMRALPWGGASIRSGGLFVSKTAGLTDNPSRLIPFNFSTAVTFVIEAGDGYAGQPAALPGLFRFSYGTGPYAGDQVTFAPSAWATGTPYAQNQQLFDTNPGNLYFVLQNYTSAGSIAADVAAGNLLLIGTYAGVFVPYQIMSPYPASVIFQVKFRQINDTFRMTHPSYPVQQLQHLADTNWTLQAVPWKYPALLDQNIAQGSTLAVAALSGSTTLTAAGSGFAPFLAAHVGSYWELQHLVDSASAQLQLSGTTGVKIYSSAIKVQGDWSFTTSQYWWGTVQLQRSVDGGTTWQVIRQFQAACDTNFSTSGTEPAPNVGDPQVQYRVAYTPAGAAFDPSIWVGSAPSEYSQAQGTLTVESTYLAGVVQVTGFVSSTQVNVQVVLAPASTNPTYLWSEGAFSAVRGYPAAIDFYEQRILYSGTAYRPNTLYGSVAGDFDNFQYGDADDAAVAFQPAVAQQNAAQWLASLLRIHMGTAGEEIIASSGNLDEAITPSNITMRRQSKYGSANLDCILAQNSLLFVERSGLRLREMRELSPYIVPTDFVAPDLTLFAEHILKPGAVQIDYGAIPDPLVFVVRSDGQLAVLYYNREQNITAWFRFVTQGTYESVCVLYGSPADSVWAIVRRTLNGKVTRCIEVFTTDPAGTPDPVNNVLLDCAYAQTQVVPPSVDQIYAPWLAGETVSAVIDGKYYPGLPADPTTGRIALPIFGTTIRAGLPYTGKVKTMKMDIAMASGTSQGRPRRVSQMVLRLKDSIGGQAQGSTDAGPFNIPMRTTATPVGAQIPLFSGDIPIPWMGGIDFDGAITVSQALPYPFCVLGIFPKFDHFGE